MNTNLCNLLFCIIFASGMKRLLILLSLQLAFLASQAMTDSLLMVQVARTGVLLKQMQYDSALAQVDRLMPTARQNHNMLAQATLHGVAGMALSRSHQLENGLLEYMRCADIAEEHNLLVKALDEKTGLLLTLFSTVYGELWVFPRKRLPTSCLSRRTPWRATGRKYSRSSVCAIWRNSL